MDSIHEILEGIPTNITDQMNRILVKPVDEHEIKTAVFSMNPNKAPGNDVNKLKPVLDKCISKNQSVSVAGRQILDNVILAHELLHNLKNKRKWHMGCMAVKLDMSKTYDRVEWDYLKAIMDKMGFCETSIDWIMKCITTVSYSFSVNGEAREFVKSERGLRQDDPLLPYIFLICSKDDSLILSKVDQQEAKKLKIILKPYEAASGQLINLEKSLVFFSKNTDQRTLEAIKEGLKEIQTKENGPLENKIAKPSWQGNFGESSNNGYSNLCHVLLQTPKEAMQGNLLMARCWWGQNDKKNKQHWIAWEKFTKNKEEGGMGFKDIQMFNKALLAKQVWRIVTQPNLLVSKVLKEKYFPKDSMLEGKVPKNASWIWQSLMSAREAIEDGCKKKVGNGRDTNIWKDKWINNDKSGRIKTQKPKGSDLQKNLTTHSST
ncbi:uncharacterized protein [Coffea arabica]|uniref:Reverse transcriptase domain-containing protein n=1 Tax=Coffea arabica TaxID=13443 RepID=A0ABM4U5K7_COFAR